MLYTVQELKKLNTSLSGVPSLSPWGGKKAARRLEHLPNYSH
jgi:hypothetical protein